LYCFSFFIELINFVLPYIFRLNDTSFLYPVYIAGEFFLLTGLFIRKLDWPAYIRGFVAAAAAGFMVSKYGFDWPSNADIAKVVSNIIIICLSGYVLIREIKNASVQGRFLLVDACIFLLFRFGVYFYHSASDCQSFGKRLLHFSVPIIFFQAFYTVHFYIPLSD
jgi:hypothetical protein